MLWRSRKKTSILYLNREAVPDPLDGKVLPDGLELVAGVAVIVLTNPVLFHHF